MRNKQLCSQPPQFRGMNHKTSHGSRNFHQQSYKNTPSSGRSNAHRIRRRLSTLFGTYLEAFSWIRKPSRYTGAHSHRPLQNFRWQDVQSLNRGIAGAPYGALQRIAPLSASSQSMVGNPWRPHLLRLQSQDSQNLSDVGFRDKESI